MIPMRIALVAHKFDFEDGQGRVNFEIARALLEHGHSVTILAEMCSARISGQPNCRFVCLRDFFLPSQLLRNLYFASRASRWMKQHRREFDLVQANGFIMWEPADIVAVHYVHTTWLRSPYFPFKSSSLSAYSWYQRILTIMNSYCELITFQSAKLLIAVSQATAHDVSLLGIARSKIRVVYNGVDLEEFHPGRSERAFFGLPDDVPLALFAGDVRTPRKNLDTMLRALVGVPDLRLVVAGSAEQSVYPAFARDLGVADRVHFIGHTDKLASLMRSVDFFVLPSRYDTYGMVVLEAMASGVPVVLSSQVGAVEFAAPVSLVLSDPEDVDTLTGFLRQLSCDLAQTKVMGENARKHVLQLTWESTTEGYMAAYRELLETDADSKEHP